MEVREIVAHVRSAIDEVTTYDPDFNDEITDDENLDAAIKDKIPYALLFIIENAPEEKLDDVLLDSLTSAEMAGVAITAEQPVKVKLPADVVRVVSARLSSWSHSPVPVTEDSQEYLMQQDDYARGSWDRPVNAIAYHGADRYLELYCAKTANDQVETAIVRKPTIDTSDDTNDVSVPVRLEAAFIYQIAGLTMVAFREQIAASLFAIAQKSLTGGD